MYYFEYGPLWGNIVYFRLHVDVNIGGESDIIYGSQGLSFLYPDESEANQEVKINDGRVRKGVKTYPLERRVRRL